MPLPSPLTPPSGTLLPGPGDGSTPGGGLPPANPVFVVEITDLYGNVLRNEGHATVDQYTGLSISCAVSEDRSGTLTMSLYHPLVAKLIMVNDDGKVIAVLGRMVRIKYRGTTQIWGLVTAAKFSTEKATVDLGIQGPTYKLRHRNVNYSDPFVGPDDAPIHSPADWTTMKAVVEAAYDTQDQYSQNIPDIGVQVINIDAVDAADGFWVDIQRGSYNWTVLTDLAESIYGAEFDVIPHDPTEDELPFDTTLYIVS